MKMAPLPSNKQKAREVSQQCSTSFTMFPAIFCKKKIKNKQKKKGHQAYEKTH